MAKTYAVVVGAVLLLVGLLGFVTSDFMGLHFNMTHNLIHLLSGIVGLAAGLTGGGKGARPFAQVFGAVYTLVAVLGFAGVGFLVELLNLNMAYNVIHLAVGVFGLLAGFTGAKTATT